MEINRNILSNCIGNSVIIYMMEFLCASFLAYLLITLYPQHRLVWAMTSIALVLSPKSEESKALIYDRIKANILGALVGFFMILIHAPTIVLFCLGIVLTILLSKHLQIYRTVRSALVAFVIITVPTYQEPRTIIALERVTCVVIGCIIALLITLFFDFMLSKYARTAVERPARTKNLPDEA